MAASTNRNCKMFFTENIIWHIYNLKTRISVTNEKNFTLRAPKSKEVRIIAVILTVTSAYFKLKFTYLTIPNKTVKMENKVKTVWILLPNLGLGGAEVFLTSLASEMSVSYNFVFFVNNKEPEIIGKNLTIKTHSNTLSFIFKILLAAWKRPPNIVLSSIIDINIISLLLKKITPKSIKYIIREALPLAEACKLTRSPKLYHFLACRLYPTADAIVSLSIELKMHLEAKIPKVRVKLHDKSVVIPNGVSEARMQDFPLFKKRNNKIVAIGRLEHQKGFDQLISAFFKFHSKHRDYELVIIGTGSQHQKLKELIKIGQKENSIHLLGRVENPTTELSTAAFFVLPSRYEGLSNAMLEALVNGVPVLATKQDTSVESVINKNNGILISRCTEDEILTGLNRMHLEISNFSREKIAQDARGKYSISASALAFRQLFEYF